MLYISGRKKVMDQSRPMVSIGMPVYNGERFIREALDSLLAQTFADFELIISDNASTDATASICGQYAKQDSRIRYLRQESNIGAAANFRFVLDQAVAPYFMWAACDDKWSSDWLEEMCGAISEDGVGMAFGQVVHINAAGQEMDHPANGVAFGYANSHSVLTRKIGYFLGYEGKGKANSIYSLYKRSLIETLNKMWLEMIAGRCKYDYTIVYSCLGFAQLRQVDYGTLFKRIHSASEGTSHAAETGMIGLAMHRVRSLIWPFLPGLFRDYLRHSTATEKAALLLLVPVKLLDAYLFRLKQIIAKLSLR